MARNPIEHLIVLCMENRSFDHFLGSLALESRRDVDGLSEPTRSIPDRSGLLVQNFQMDLPGPAAVAPGLPDLPHGWNDAHSDWNAGANDGFLRTYQLAHPNEPGALANVPMGYYTRETLSVLYALADKFVVCDRWHASVLSSTWPNRKYLHSGQRDADQDTQTIPGLKGFQTNPIYERIAEALDPDTKRPITWRCYFSDIPFLGFWYRFAFRNVRNFETLEAYLRDCVNGTLPTISVIDPPFTLADDHPPHDPLLGEKFIGLVVDALTNSPSWKNSALLIIYDEFGGFYDHIAPPEAPEPNAADTPLGFRVPAIIISPYTKRGHVSHVTYDHTSFMKSISDRWSVDFDGPDAPFGVRWKHVQAFWEDCFDFDAPPLDCATYTGEGVKETNWGAGVRQKLDSPLGAFEAALERIFVLPELKALDRRAAAFETLGRFEHDVITLKRSTKYR